MLSDFGVILRHYPQLSVVGGLGILNQLSGVIRKRQKQILVVWKEIAGDAGVISHWRGRPTRTFDKCKATKTTTNSRIRNTF